MSSAANNTLKHLPQWDGNRKTFQVWWTRFKSYATLHGWSAALKEDYASKLPSKEEGAFDTSDPRVAAAQEAAVKKNHEAVLAFVMSFTSDQCMAVYYATQTDDWPNGVAWKIAKRIRDEYQPNDRIALVEYRTMLSEVKMKDNDEPKVMFDQIANICNMFQDASFTINEDELIAVVMQKAPRKYMNMIAMTQDKKGVNLELADLKKTMEEFHRMDVGNLKFDKGSESKRREIALAGADGSGGVKCYTCGKAGHKSYQCKSKKDQEKSDDNGDSKKSRFKGTCNHCGKVGHRKKDCWDLPENEDKRPKNYKSKSGGANSETGAAGIEALLCSVDGIGVSDIGYVADGLEAVGSAAGEIGGVSFVSNGDDIGDVAAMSCESSLSFPDSVELLKDSEIWIGDTGASSHSTFCDDGMIDKKAVENTDGITVGNGEFMKPECCASIPVSQYDKHGNYAGDAVLRDVLYSKASGFNMFSMTKAMKDGWMLSGDNKSGLALTKGERKIVFDIRITTRRGVLFCACFKRRGVNGEEVAASAAVIKKAKTLNIKAAHDQLGHCDEEKTRDVARSLGWIIVRGTLPPCKDCAAGKAKQRNVPKVSAHKVSTEVNGRVFVDLSTIRSNKDFKVTNPNWVLKVDERTQMKFTSFHESKNAMVEPACEQFAMWKNSGRPVKTIRCDNAGENKLLQSRANSVDWQLGIQFEFTARSTPQQNSLVEVGFATLANRGRAMMHRANLPLRLRYLLFKEALKTATLLDGLIVVNIDGVAKPRVVHWCGELPRFANHLRTWGEAGTVTLKTQGMSKLEDRGVQCMFVGYALNHEGGCYRMWDPITSRVHVTRDIVWLKRMFFARPPELGDDEAVSPGVLLPIAEPDENEEAEADDNDEDTADDTPADVDESSLQQPPVEDLSGDGDDEANDNEDKDDEDEALDAADGPPVTTKSGRAIRTPSRLIQEIGALTTQEERFMEALSVLGFEQSEIACVGAGIGGGYDDTTELKVMTYREAMESKDRVQWLVAKEEEHQKMLKYQVWVPKKLSEVPKLAKIIDAIWAMKKKANGIFRARLVGRGFRQVDGEHYDSASISSPVTNDTTIRIILTLMVMMLGDGRICDVHGAFLHGLFQDDEEIYMRVPEGLEEHYGKDVVLLLKKTIYGLKQSARAFWRELLKAMNSMGFERSAADACLYFKWVNGRLCTWMSWIDDCFVSGHEDDVKEATAQMKSLFDCEEIETISEYVGCKLDYNKVVGKLKITQPVLLQSFHDEFPLPNSERKFKTPAEPGQVLERGGAKNCEGPEKQTKFRSGVGKLLHLSKWSRPDIANAVRELSRCCGVAKKAHFKALFRVMKYCYDTKEKGWIIKPNRRWDGKKGLKFEVKGWSDSNYAACVETRKSVSGYVVELEGVNVVIKCAGQSIVTLSVTEAELFAAVLCAQDMLYVKKVLESMGLEVKLPMILYMDNQGAIDLVNSWSVGGRTRHIETRQWFLRELKEKGIIRVEWVSGEKNKADLLTKNATGGVFERHCDEFCAE